MSKPAQRRLLAAFDYMARLKTDWLINELGRQERRDLDLALLTAMGASPEEAGSLIIRLYEQLHDFYTVARETEKQAQDNRARTARGGDSSPESSVTVDWKIFDETDKVGE